MPGFAGVDLDKAINDAGLEGKAPSAAPVSGDNSSSSAPAADDGAAAALEGDTAAAEPQGDAARAAEAAKINDFLDFEANKGKKVKVGDQEFTLEELQKGYMRQADYTRKTQETAQLAKYRDNLQYDLDKIASDPSLLPEFLKVYPKQFHRAAELVAARRENPETNRQGQENGENGGHKNDPELVKRLAKLEEGEASRQAEAREREIANYEREIDTHMKALSPKYPFADDDAVLAKAQGLLSLMRQKANERGEDPSKVKLTKEHWEKVYKLTHEQSEAKYKAHYNAQRKKQSDAHAQGKDVAAGGGIPGQSPRPMKMKDVADHMIASLESRSANAP